MNYYEELGVAPEATEQEIRKAHRRLVKLMHPDAQPDQSLKMLAETQMRRLNSIVSTLLDPDQRRIYDDQLHASAHVEYSKTPNLPGLRGVPWWIASSLCAVVLTLAVIWMWADHMSNTSARSRTAVYIPPAEQTPVLVSPSVSYKPPVDPLRPSDANPDAPPPEQQMPLGSGVSTAVVPDVTPDSKPPLRPQPSAPEPQHKPVEVADGHSPAVSKKPVTKPVTGPIAKPVPKIESQKVEGNGSNPPPQSKAADPKSLVAHNTDAKTVSIPVPATKKAFSLPSGSVVAHAVNSNAKTGGTALPPPPGVNNSAAHDYNSPALIATNLPAAVPPRLAVVTTGGSPISSRDPLEGEWIYAPKEPEKRKAGFYPPEFIDLKLFGAGDPGSLKGQYSAKYVVTDRPVSSEVSFELASVSKGSRRFNWQSNNGAKGTLSIDPIDERTIRIDWRTTSAIRGPALTSGTATLVRRQ